MGFGNRAVAVDEYTKAVKRNLTPALTEYLRDVVYKDDDFDDEQTEWFIYYHTSSKHRTTVENHLKDMPRMNTDQINDAVKTVTNAIRLSDFDLNSILKAIFVGKCLTIASISDAKEHIALRTPTKERFVHVVLNNIAADILTYPDVMVFRDGVSPENTLFKCKQLPKLLSRSIDNAIMDLTPFSEMSNRFLQTIVKGGASIETPKDTAAVKDDEPKNETAFDSGSDSDSDHEKDDYNDSDTPETNDD